MVFKLDVVLTEVDHLALPSVGTPKVLASFRTVLESCKTVRFGTCKILRSQPVLANGQHEGNRQCWLVISLQV